MTSTRKTLLATIAILMTALVVNSALAAAGETALGKCYNMVISSCNETSSHPIPCAENGMDACDEEYGNQTAGTRPNGFAAPKPRPTPPVTALILPAVQQAREAAR